MKKRKRIIRKTLTLSQIAQKAGVSTATVSLALNKSPLVAEKTRKRILEIAKAENYRPNLSARRLSTGYSESITLFCVFNEQESSGWVLNSTWDYYNPILKSIYFTLLENNYQLQFEIVTFKEIVEKKIILNKIQDRSADGILLLITNKNDYSFLSKTLNFPIVTLNGKISSDFCSVTVDDVFGASEAINYLLSLGHRRIAHIAGPADQLNAIARQEGYVKALCEAKINVNPNYILEGDWRIESGERLMRRLLELESPPTALFCANDHMAFGAIKTIKSFGLDVPRDISIVGYDDSDISKVIFPELTTIQPPLEEIGTIGANELIKAINDENFQVKHIVIPPKLIKRNSCNIII